MADLGAGRAGASAKNKKAAHRADDAPGMPRARKRWIAAGLALALGIAALLGWAPTLLRPQPPAQGAHTPYDDDGEARELYRTATFEVTTRSADGLAGAQRSFKQLVDRYPDRAAGWAGLADTSLLLREFGSMPDAAAYPQAARAARTALALDPKLAAAWVDEAFVLWWWRGDAVAAFRAFDTALELDPTGRQVEPAARVVPKAHALVFSSPNLCRAAWAWLRASVCY